MSSLKKGKPSERETARLTKVGQVETVIDVGVGIISPPWRVNSKLRSFITVLTVFMIFKMRSKYFNFKSFLSELIFNLKISNFVEDISLRHTSLWLKGYRSYQENYKKNNCIRN